ncbi:IMPACT family protein [Croceitalea rosinachiae]|uniref:YigZ family protein n=1 Tax=Croceitalea rosinachiae TaxID=3075596 RepID=A0ABU3AAP8_9FLAO|nr:YigZ family protein [Croceitalea sp. F388]MDT0607255.1 YigZ family protein [Croceitalea sp. F388]
MESNIKDTYRTLKNPSEEILYKDRKSKFYGYAFPLISEESVKPIIEGLRKKYHTAGHVCYAWQLGVGNITYRTNDDGEPNNSSGMPIYGQIKTFEVTNVLVAVPRIFGGVKLGVGGLIQAYKTTAQLTLENSDIIEKILETYFQLNFEYSEMDKVMRIIKQHNLKLTVQKMELQCEFQFSCRKSMENQVLDIFKKIHRVSIKKLNF